jgi:hypothetical protein
MPLALLNNTLKSLEICGFYYINISDNLLGMNCVINLILLNLI